MRRSAFVVVAVAIVACNVLTGVNDFSAPDCEDCERRECADDFSACIADKPCGDFVHCLAMCSSTSCPMPCTPPPPPPTGSKNVSADLQACAQTRCAVCAAAGPPADGGAR